MQKIKINKINNSYWYYPSIFTISKNNWSSRPYKNLLDLFKKNDIYNLDGIISINPDGAIDAFNFSQKRWTYSFELNKGKDYLKKENQKIIFQEKIKDYPIEIIWTKKAITKIMKGQVPFISPKTLAEDFLNNCENAKIEWQGKRFDWFKE